MVVGGSIGINPDVVCIGEERERVCACSRSYEFVIFHTKNKCRW